MGRRDGPGRGPGTHFSGLRIARACLAAAAAWFSLGLAAADTPADAPAGSAAVSAAVGDLPREVDGPVGRRTPQDHSQFKQLQGPFTAPEQVTQACLSCHTKSAHQVQSTLHWTWKAWNPNTRQVVGKNAVYNTFCVSPISNEQFCTVCHTGYGSTDPNTFIPFEQRAEDKVDCLACHDKTGTYRKMPFLGGNPAMSRIEVRPGCGEVYGTDKPYVDPLDLSQVARHVGAPGRSNCGACHFYGGGGDGVKHGDLDSSLVKAGKSLDVHMDATGLNFSCQSCHQASDHRISGEHYAIDAAPTHGADMRGHADNGNAATCQSCHGQAPHKGKSLVGGMTASTLNLHTRNIACQTCHIPAFARGGIPTKTDWDYATAGKLSPNGSPLVVMDDKGWNSYWGVKGSFAWGENVVPEYRWFNGTERWMHVGEKVQDHQKDGVVQVNDIEGSAGDGHSRIWPFKIMHNHQPYDTESGVLAVFHSFGFDENAFTMTYDWQKAIGTGMKAAGLPYSGHYDFVKTQMFWPITHMVAPKEKAVGCVECHRDNGRLAGIDGVYLPARDRLPLLDLIGGGLAALTLLGVIVHGALRLFLGRKGK